jgi:hypothetical protein
MMMIIIIIIIIITTKSDNSLETKKLCIYKETIYIYIYIIMRNVKVMIIKSSY